MYPIQKDIPSIIFHGDIKHIIAPDVEVADYQHVDVTIDSIVHMDEDFRLLNSHKKSENDESK